MATVSLGEAARFTQYNAATVSGAVLMTPEILIALWVVYGGLTR
jgi:hypothetical protein